MFEQFDDIATINVNGRPPAFLGDHHYFIGVGLYQKSDLHISGTWKSKSHSLLRNFFALLYSPDVFYFTHTVRVQRPEQQIKSALRIPASTWKRVRKKDPKREMYRQKLRETFRRTDGELKDFCWQKPLNSRINSPFGKGRILPNGRRYYHSGVDYRARVGTPLPAVMDGEVVFADKMVVPGNTVLVYHGSGITSQFMHLNRIKSKEGDFVDKGQILGLSGATGRVEGPHLHWEMHWHGRKLDAIDFVDKMNKVCQKQKS